MLCTWNNYPFLVSRFFDVGTPRFVRKHKGRIKGEEYKGGMTKHAEAKEQDQYCKSVVDQSKLGVKFL